MVILRIKAGQMMHDADILTDDEQGITIEPDSHIMFRRFVALVIDSVILAFMISWCARTFGVAQLGTNTPIPGLLFGAGGTMYSISSGSGATTTWSVGLPSIWQIIFIFLYFSLQEFFFCATIGKFFMYLRVISQSSDSTYSRLTIKDALLRNLVRFVDAISMYLLGFIFCICSSKRRRLGDMLAKTLVVSRDSVPYLSIPRKQIKHGAQIIILLCIVIAIGSPIYAYFWQPPIIIQNNIATQQLFPGEQVLHYTLGAKTWAKNASGQPTVTYPMQFVMQSQLGSFTYSCKGSVTLTWQWTNLTWRLANAPVAPCNDYH
jgi:uncharacterized RDD family membrane protein YckC